MRNRLLGVSLLCIAALGCSPNEPAQFLMPSGTNGSNSNGGADDNGKTSTPTGGSESPQTANGVSNGGRGTTNSGSTTVPGSQANGGANASTTQQGQAATGGTPSGTKTSQAGRGGSASTTKNQSTRGGAVSTSTSQSGSGGTGSSTKSGQSGAGDAAATGGFATTSRTNTVAAGGTVAGSCSRDVGACAAPVVNVTEVNVGSAVTGYGQEGDTDPFPMAIAATPSGGSRLAWLGTDKKVYVGELDCDDKLVGTPFSFPAVDLQDIIADDRGGVVLLTRDATNGGTDNCGSGKLCGGTSSPCRTMWMVRFDSSGKAVWETQVTNLSSSLAGYQNGARFIWWYQHHGRLASDGSNYAAFFGVAITVNNGSCVDIHEGDRMQVVGPTGSLLTGHGSFEVGMSHAWTSRIVWDQRSSKFAMSDATDNNCRIAIPGAATTIASGSCDGTLFNGDLVLATSSGYWNAWSQGGTIRLEHFTTGKSDKTVTGGKSAHPHLVSYGANNMLLAWSSGNALTAQVRDAGANADTIGSEFAIAVSDHDYGAMKAYPDGSVAYAASGSNNKSIKIARVMPCQ